MNIEKIILKKKELEQKVKDMKSKIEQLKGKIKQEDRILSVWKERFNKIRECVRLQNPVYHKTRRRR